MSFWQDVQTVAGVGGAFAWLALGLVAAALALSALVPAERRRIHVAAMLFLLSLAGLFLAATLLHYGFDPNANTAYRWVRWVAQFTLCAAVINLSSVAVFDLLLG